MIISINRIRPNSTMASARIATWLGDQMKLPVVSSRAELEAVLAVRTLRFPVLVIVNGPVVFCNFDDLIEEAIYRAKNLVYVQNDYAIEVLKNTANPNQKNRLRAAMYKFKGKLSYWTSVESTLARAPDTSTLVNWNALTWRAPKEPPKGKPDPRVLYYGAFRKGRIPSFDKYFGAAPGSFYVSTTSAGEKQFREKYRVPTGPAVIDVIQEFRGRFVAGLLIADRLSNKTYHCPPNRWYEMLSMELPVLVDEPCTETLRRAGFQATPNMTVTSAADVLDFISSRRKLKSIADEQRAWREKNPLPQLRKELKMAMKKSGVLS